MKRKCLAVGIILLFVATGVIPSTAQKIEKPSLPTSRGNWLYVGGNGPGNYTTIQSAINAANPGDTIYVFNGVYHENLDIGKDSISILGEDKDNTIIDGNGSLDVIFDVQADSINISNFNIQNEYGGIYLFHSSNTMITSNIIDVDGYGIWLRCSGNNKIINNVLLNCFAGIYFQMSDEIGSGGNFLRYNTMVNCGFMIRGSTLSDYINDIDVSNTINGKPIYYYINETNGFVPSDAGEVFLIDCDYFVVSNIIFNEGNMCVTLAYSNFNTIEAIKDNSDGEGLYLDSSNENLIQNNHNISFEMVNSDNNNIINNSCEGLFLTECSGNNINSNFISKDYAGNGIYLYRNSDNNIIINNIIKLNQSSYGITLGSDENSNNIIKENTIKNAIIGLRIYTSSNNNEIYHNSFFNNTQNAYDECINNWDNGYPSGGNYWDDYNGSDIEKDGIGDTPYSILGGNNQDQYPLMLPYGMTNLTITFVPGPFKSLISIKNIGSTTALNVQNLLTLKGGFLFCAREYFGVTMPLLPGEEIAITLPIFFFGFGYIHITNSVWADNAPIITEKINGILLLFFFILKH